MQPPALLPRVPAAVATYIARSRPVALVPPRPGPEARGASQTAERNSGAIRKAWEKLAFGLRVGWGETLREKAPSARARCGCAEH